MDKTLLIVSGVRRDLLPDTFRSGAQKPGFWLRDVNFRIAESLRSNKLSVRAGKNRVSSKVFGTEKRRYGERRDQSKN